MNLPAWLRTSGVGTRRGRRCRHCFPKKAATCVRGRGVRIGSVGRLWGRSEQAGRIGSSLPVLLAFSETGLRWRESRRSLLPPLGSGLVHSVSSSSATRVSLGIMAGVFPYRGPGNPVPGPLAPLPDYMSEEKLQEKGEERARGASRAGGWAAGRVRACVCAFRGPQAPLRFSASQT